MCSCADGSRLHQAAVRAAFGALLLMAAGCFESHPCQRERCDGLDNDCDRRIDEDFLNGEGLYAATEHCGACKLACDDVFPSAASTQCVVRSGRAQCELVRCEAGETLAGSGACAPVVPVTCLACSTDEECALRSSGAQCVTDALGGGHCAPSCDAVRACPSGFQCRQLQASGAAICVPESGACTCDASMEGVEFGCELQRPGSDSAVCAGVQRCSAAQLGACEPALEEACNGMDDDCDGSVDEGFVDDRGRYATLANCGSCGAPCAALGPHMRASCELALDAAECQRECLDGFVDLDGFAANGCECELLEDSRPRVGGDSDCDGQLDPTPELVFVSQAGDDAQPGTSAESPVRSLQRGLELGASLGRDVLVARGVYAGPLSIVAGIAVTGGYSPDFVAHDPRLYPVLIEGAAASSGAPVLHCEDVNVPTRIEDLTFEASAGDAAGEGSTAVLLDRCGSELVLERVSILAARAAAGRAGEDSSSGLPAIGLRTLADLAGSAGTVGMPGGSDAVGCPTVAGGAGGAKTCPSGDVGGGRGGDARCALLDCENGAGIPCGNAGCTDFTSGGACDIAAARAIATPNPEPASGRGSVGGRAGVATYDAPTNHGACSFCDDNPSLPRFGDDGGDGRAGADGAGGRSCAAGLAIDASGRVAAADGGRGESGVDGSGGGGGSAGAGFSRIRNTRGDCRSAPGGAGGGGGSGGCGAPAAAGGGGGGGSIGVLIRFAPGQSRGPIFRDVRVVTASGGDGGDGGSGAAGGVSGSGGIGGESDFWCARSGGRGGTGGPGGAGGGGAGGCGGPSVGVYLAANGGEAEASYLDELRANLRIELAGAAGRGGRAGFSPGQSGDAGRDGARADLRVD